MKTLTLFLALAAMSCVGLAAPYDTSPDGVPPDPTSPDTSSRPREPAAGFFQGLIPPHAVVAVDAGCVGCVEDDAQVVSHTLPTTMACASTASATVTLRNTGTRNWSRTGSVGEALGYVGDVAAPFLPPGTPARVVIPPGVTVAPGAQVTFAVALRAPTTAGQVPASFQMVREGVHWFGAEAASTIDVRCTPETGCSFPQGVPEADFTGSSATDATVANAVNTVMEELSGCSRGSHCDLNAQYPDAQAWFAAVTARLRQLGYCAGQHEVGATDEIAVSTSGCGGLWYGYHIYYYGGGTVVWNPGAQRGAWTIVPSNCP
jgi:hypothetical protein